ncbi:MAG TPA: DUF5996 family protein, partial [Thermoanaerobaculia bacterium]|nr:DUF5996 family protein [Thermoanaerobaculia bacterium]
MARNDRWPALPYGDWADTCTTLHLWSQIVGKVRLVSTPWLNHSWNATLYPCPRGLTTGAMAQGERSFQIDFDFFDQRLVVSTDDGRGRELPLPGQTVASFFRGLLGALGELDLPVRIHGAPNEVEEAIPFAEDARGSYDADAARRFSQVLLESSRVLQRFRSRFLGKSSPVHFFWGGFDLAVTRFSGRPAPEHPGGFPHLPDAVTREAYSHEVSSVGFWPGTPQFPQPAYYSYAYPPPAGFADASVAPDGATFDPGLGEFVLPYDAVRTAEAPDAALLAFCQSTYEAAAEAAGWDR